MTTVSDVLAQPIVGVLVGSLIGFAGSAFANWGQAKQAKNTVVINWLQTYISQLQKLLTDFDQPDWGIVEGKVNPTEPTIREYERTASSYFKFGVLLSPSTRASLEPARRMARTAYLIIQARERKSEQMEKLAIELPRLDGFDVTPLENKPDGDLLMFLSHFLQEYRGALLYVHDASLEKMQQLAGMR